MTPSEKRVAGCGLSLLVLGFAIGCASDSAFRRADCTRFRFYAYNVLACNDRAVGEHCRRVCKLTDTGKPVDYYPRACFEPNRWGRRHTVVIGGSYMGCLPHEVCHLEHPGDPAKCALEYPCVEDAK